MLPLLIVGGILLALAALLLAPVRLELSFREAFSAQVRYLFFRIPLAPGKEEEPHQRGEEGHHEAVGQWTF